MGSSCPTDRQMIKSVWKHERVAGWNAAVVELKFTAPVHSLGSPWPNMGTDGRRVSQCLWEFV